MTHEELLEILEHTAQDGMADEPVLKALSAVVELHMQIDDNSCHHCATWYPCPTIQAIEKELG